MSQPGLIYGRHFDHFQDGWTEVSAPAIDEAIQFNVSPLTQKAGLIVFKESDTVQIARKDGSDLQVESRLTVESTPSHLVRKRQVFTVPVPQLVMVNLTEGWSVEDYVNLGVADRDGLIRFCNMVGAQAVANQRKYRRPTTTPETGVS